MIHATTQALVFVLGRYLRPDAEACVHYCLARGYHVVGIVKDDWAAAVNLVRQGKATVIVAADPHHLDPQRTPRVEFASENGPDGQHRPRIVEK